MQNLEDEIETELNYQTEVKLYVVLSYCNSCKLSQRMSMNSNPNSKPLTLFSHSKSQHDQAVYPLQFDAVPGHVKGQDTVNLNEKMGAT